MVVGEFTQDADVVVIGGGPAGYACAFAAAQAGRTVTVIDPRPTLGGACLYDACIPTKTVLHTVTAAQAASHKGLSGDPPVPETAALAPWIDRVVRRLGSGLTAGAGSHDVQVIAGTARFLSSREIQVAGDEVSRLRFKRAVICTGSTPQPHPGVPESTRVITPAQLAEDPTRASGRTLVLGCDAVAVESASICAGLGGSVSLAPCADVLLPGIPRPLVDPLAGTLDVLAGGELSIEDGGECLVLVLDGARREVDLVVDASSRVADIADLGLDTTSVQTADSWVTVDDRMQTADPRILAAGDCVGSPLWAGAAGHRGRIAAETICGGHGAWDPLAVPQVLFTAPQVCWCGADDQTDDVSSLVVPWTYSGLAVAMDRPGGCTMICWETESGVLVGGGAVGEGATELAGGITIAIEMGATLRDLADMVSAHPTRGELLFDAARQALAENS